MGEHGVDEVVLEVVGLAELLAFVAANACLDLARKADLQNQNTQVAEDRKAYCNQALVQSYRVEVHSRGRTVEGDNSHRIEVVGGYPGGGNGV